MTGINYEAAAAKAEDQSEWAGTDGLGWDSYAANIVNAALGDMEALYYVDYSNPGEMSWTYAHIDANGERAYTKGYGVLTQVCLKENSDG